jgi:glycosyltransferase involved in cell wall biosynthesis
MGNTKVSVFCIWRDSAGFASRTLKQLEELEALECDFSFFFFENDSTDGTPDILSDWMRGRSGKFESKVLKLPKFGSVQNEQRMSGLCQARNKCKALAGDNKSDISVVFDADVRFDPSNFLTQLGRFDRFDDAVMITPNVRQNIPDFVLHRTPDSYYDVYPFRDKHGSPGMYCCDCPSFIYDDHVKWVKGEPILVMSAFGGFVVVKSEAFNKVHWSSDFYCDHVNLCYDLSRFGTIYIDPNSKVFVTNDQKPLMLESMREKSQETFKRFYYHKTLFSQSLLPL